MSGGGFRVKKARQIRDAASFDATVELVDADDLRPAGYNPREVVPERLDLVELSLRKLGWLLPIYADPDGEIMSGHQRHHVATERLGWTRLPVVRTKTRLTAGQRRTLNMAFNRATNDLASAKDADDVAVELLNSDVPLRAAELPDVAGDAIFPVLAAEPVDLLALLDANPLWTDEKAVALAAKMVSLAQVATMPIVRTPSNRIVNGIIRATIAARSGVESIAAVTIPDEVADVAFGLLNLLSMRYSVGTISDELRFNAFKAAPHSRDSLSVNARRDLLRRMPHVKTFDHARPEHAAAWLRHYGDTVLDFGAGKLWDAQHMEQMGASVAAFEPYYMMDLDVARETAERWFFSRIEDGREFSSIFLSNVFNSVLIAALAGPSTVVHATSRPAAQLAIERRDVSAVFSTGQFRPGYEENVTIGNMHTAPMMQKFHRVDELADEWRTGFDVVEAGDTGFNVWITAQRPKPVDAEELGRAIDFEFDLPWPNGRTFGMAARAREAFRRRGLPV